MDCMITLVVALAAWGLGVLFGRRMRAGESAGLPTELHPHDHDEPQESAAEPVDAQRHHHESDIDKAGEFRDIRRTLGG